MIAAADITKGQEFTIEGRTLTATEDVRVDKLSALGGYKVAVTEAGDAEEFYRLFGLNDMVAA
jgi:hypothetical protein